MNTRLVWYLIGRFGSGCQMVVILDSKKSGIWMVCQVTWLYHMNNGQSYCPEFRYLIFRWLLYKLCLLNWYLKCALIPLDSTFSTAFFSRAAATPFTETLDRLRPPMKLKQWFALFWGKFMSPVSPVSYTCYSTVTCKVFLLSIEFIHVIHVTSVQGHRGY